MLVGLPEPNPSDEGRPLFNTAALLRGGRVEQRFRKALLPTYDVFDEDRYFEPFHGAQVLDLAGDARRHQHLRGHLERSRLLEAAPLPPRSDRGARRAPARASIVNLSASPFTAGKHRLREEMLGSMAAQARRADRLRQPVRRQRRPRLRRPQLRVRRATALSSRAAARSTPTSSSAISTRRSRSAPASDDCGVESEIWRALVLGTRDYARKCGFTRSVLGLSGGIDSALTAAIAAEALGADNVLGVLMPSPFSSRGSVDDALAAGAEPRHRDA